MVAIVITIITIQFLMAILNLTYIGTIAGKWKLILVCILSLVGGIINLRLTGMSWTDCFFNSTILGGMQVFFHQVWKQFREEEY